MSETLIYQKQIDDVGLFRIYAYHARARHFYSFRFELWVYKNLDTNTITISFGDDDIKNAIDYIVNKSVGYAMVNTLFLVPNRLSHSVFCGLESNTNILVSESNGTLTFSAPGAKIGRGLYTSIYNANLY